MTVLAACCLIVVAMAQQTVDQDPAAPQSRLVVDEQRLTFSVAPGVAQRRTLLFRTRDGAWPALQAWPETDLIDASTGAAVPRDQLRALQGEFRLGIEGSLLHVTFLGAPEPGVYATRLVVTDAERPAGDHLRIPVEVEIRPPGRRPDLDDRIVAIDLTLGWHELLSLDRGAGELTTVLRETELGGTPEEVQVTDEPHRHDGARLGMSWVDAPPRFRIDTRGASPGIYRGALSVRHADGTSRPQRVPVVVMARAGVLVFAPFVTLGLLLGAALWWPRSRWRVRRRIVRDLRQIGDMRTSLPRAERDAIEHDLAKAVAGLEDGELDHARTATRSARERAQAASHVLTVVRTRLKADETALAQGTLAPRVRYRLAERAEELRTRTNDGSATSVAACERDQAAIAARTASLVSIADATANLTPAQRDLILKRLAPVRLLAEVHRVAQRCGLWERTGAGPDDTAILDAPSITGPAASETAPHDQVHKLHIRAWPPGLTLRIAPYVIACILGGTLIASIATAASADIGLTLSTLGATVTAVVLSRATLGLVAEPTMAGRAHTADTMSGTS